MQDVSTVLSTGAVAGCTGILLLALRHSCAGNARLIYGSLGVAICEGQPLPQALLRLPMSPEVAKLV